MKSWKQRCGRKDGRDRWRDEAESSEEEEDGENQEEEEEEKQPEEEEEEVEAATRVRVAALNRRTAAPSAGRGLNCTHCSFAFFDESG